MLSIFASLSFALFAGIIVGETVVRLERAYTRRRTIRTAERRLRYLQGTARRDRLPGVVIFRNVPRGRIPWTISHGASWSFLSVAPFKTAARPVAGFYRDTHPEDMAESVPLFWRYDSVTATFGFGNVQ